MQLTLSERAARRIDSLKRAEADPHLKLRVSVSGGGCSGFQYAFALDTETQAKDRVFSRDGVDVVVDDVSLALLDGAEIDFVEDLVGSYFAIRNPNASATCGCGSSFSVG